MPIKAAPTQPADLDPRPIEEIWAEYRRAGSDRTRHFLIERFMPKVRYIARRIHARLPGRYEFDDLLQSGTFGLMDALDTFKLDRGVKFETYAAPRIRGAIIDELRSLDWVPRLTRSRSAQVDQARDQLRMSLGRLPTDDEVAADLNLSREEFELVIKDADPIKLRSMNRPLLEPGRRHYLSEAAGIQDAKQVNPLMALQKRDAFRQITRGLDRTERLIILLYYHEELTMREIGQVLELTPSRVSQIHSSVLARIKASMRSRQDHVEADDAPPHPFSGPAGGNGRLRSRRRTIPRSD